MSAMERIQDVGLLLRTAPEPTGFPQSMLFESLAASPTGRFSRNLSTTLRLCERRQAWYRAYLVEMGEDRLPFVGSRLLAERDRGTARSMRLSLFRSGRSVDGPARRGDLFDAVVEMVEAAGTLVMMDEPVAADLPSTLAAALHDDFRGITLVDDMAPVIFINGAQPPRERLLWLIRHLALLWLGLSGVSREAPRPEARCPVGRWCDEVAADAVDRLTDLAYERALVLDDPTENDFSMRLSLRASRRFCRALIASTLEGKTLYREAFQLLDVPGTDAFNAIRRSLGSEL